MKLRTLLAAGVGFVAGALVVLALLLFNPLVKTAQPTPPISEADAGGNILETFTIDAPGDIVAVTHNGSNIIDPRPTGIALFDEQALQPGLLLVAKVRNAKRQVIGFATESEAIDPGSNPLLGRMRMNTDWTIVIPGRGTIFATQIEDAGALGKEILPAVMLGNGWNGKADFVSTVGPGANGRGIIVGGTQAFQGIAGSFVEVSHLTHLSRKRGGIGSFELQLSYRLPAAK